MSATNTHPHLHLLECPNLAVNCVNQKKRPSFLVRGGQFAAFDNGGRFSGVKAFLGFRLPTFPLNCDAHMLIDGPKGGLAAGLGHEVTDALVDTPDKRKVIGSQF